MKMPVRVFHKLKATNFKSEIVFSENRNVTLALQHTFLFLSNIKLYHLSFLLTQVWCELLSEKFQYFHQKWFTKSSSGAF